jgi:hypothetical protein
MSQPLFNTDKCDIPSIPSLAFDFVSDCSVPQAPPPIIDCTKPPIPPEPPPVCPEFSAKVNVDANFTACSARSDSAAIIFTKIDDDPCRFFVDLDLKLNLPLPQVPCPEFSVGSVEMLVEFADCLPPAAAGAAMVITKETFPGSCNGSNGPVADTCKFTVDFAVAIPIPRPPCPEISVGQFSVNTDWADCITGPSALTITKTAPAKKCWNNGSLSSQDPCEFIIDLDLQIPIPRIPCPTFMATGTIAYAALPGPEILVMGEVVPPPQKPCGNKEPQEPCEIDLAIDILIPPPPCPEITAALELTGIATDQDPEGTLIVIPNIDFSTGVTAPCKFEIELDLKIPKPCVPRFWCSARFPTGNCSFIEMLAPGEDPYVTLAFEKVPGPFPPPNDCDYEIGLDIGIPMQPCPEITATLDVTSITAGTEPTGTLSVNPSGPLDATGPCQYNLDLALKIPRTCVPYFWCSARFPTGSCAMITRIDATQDAYVDFTFEKGSNRIPAGECDYEIGLEIGLPVTGIQVITNITCVNGEIIVTKETIDVVLPPPNPV